MVLVHLCAKYAFCPNTRSVNARATRVELEQTRAADNDDIVLAII